uniref:Uncharacterized protein n=1 Tax=uncultured Caudovirales phage TaxID=2100421 RepID=A0A6J5L057_9CAUD|nr:hypothetical protein UFOVP114_9 [uncultured Caudovirales phage]
MTSRNSSTPEPAPIHNDHAPLWPAVIVDLQRMGAPPELIQAARDRDAFGRAKYGTPLQPHNGRDPVVDAQQEALDLCVYSKQALAEGRDGVLPHDYELSLQLARRLFGDVVFWRQPLPQAIADVPEGAIPPHCLWCGEDPGGGALVTREGKGFWRCGKCRGPMRFLPQSGEMCSAKANTWLRATPSEIDAIVLGDDTKKV